MRATNAHDGGGQPLLDYVEQLEAARPKLTAASREGHAGARDDVVSSLMEFAREIEPRTPNIQMAAAAKAVKSAPKIAADAEATFVGSQVCMGCHASHAAAFNLTIMGRIFRNPRNAQEKGGCETCHGAGSLHVKAGGGRGVGGIISFRKDDTSRSVAGQQRDLPRAATSKGDRTLLAAAARTRTRDVACTNCHTVMRNVTPKLPAREA